MTQRDLQAKLDAVAAEEQDVRQALARDADLDPRDPLQRHRIEQRQRRQDRLVQLRADREALCTRPEEPSRGVTARVELPVEAVTVQQTVGAAVLVSNLGTEPVRIAAVLVTIPPGTGPAPAEVTFSQPLLIEPGEEARTPTSIVFHAPQTPPAVLVEVTALVRLASGGQVTAEPAKLVVKPPGV